MSATNGKAKSSSLDALLGNGRPEHGKDPIGNNFDLRGTLAETEVREASFGEFLDALKQAGKAPA